MISRPYFPWISLAKTEKPKKNNEKKPLPIPTNRFLGKFPSPIPERFRNFLNRFGMGAGINIQKAISIFEYDCYDIQK